MRNKHGKILYIGKAKNIKRRVLSYFQKKPEHVKTARLIAQVTAIDTTITNTEKEALLLECNLIKTHKPRYNFCLKDDKSYPYLVLSKDPFPRLFATRARAKQKEQRFGPYPSMGSVRSTLALLQKIFKLRQCDNSFFKHRTRPCLQYQIKRCTAPCVNHISPAAYKEDVHHLTQFLQGHEQAVLMQLSDKMLEASNALDFELAANLRDQQQQLRALQEEQLIHTQQQTSVDVIAIATQENQYGVHVLMIRQGRLLGSRTYHPNAGLNDKPHSVLAAFLAQFYTGQLGALNLPREVLIQESTEDILLLQEALALKFDNTAPTFKTSPRGIRRKWMDLAIVNANAAIATNLAMSEHYKAKLMAVQKCFHLKTMPTHMECFDISHTFGESPVASCVVFDYKGASKKNYRQFNITNITKGDDYAAIAHAVSRRYLRLKKEDKPMPSIIFIDGGKGQLAAARDAMQELQLNEIVLVAIAKGPERKPGKEILWTNQHARPLSLNENDPALHLIQQIRDEAHRFALYAHRKKRSKRHISSPLDAIPGIGPTKKAMLLNYFGGWQSIKKASIHELCKVNGINQKLAQIIHETLQNID